jgi:hypothetical protein
MHFDAVQLERRGCPQQVRAGRNYLNILRSSRERGGIQIAILTAPPSTGIWAPLM